MGATGRASLAVLAGAGFTVVVALVAAPAIGSDPPVPVPPSPSATTVAARVTPAAPHAVLVGAGLSAADARIAELTPLRAVNPRIGKDYGISIVDAATGELIWSRGGADRMLPASNMKVITAANALAALGPGHRFTTNVAAVAPDALALVGGGDSTLDESSLRQLARQTAARIKSGSAPVHGSRSAAVRVFADDSRYPEPTRPAGWPREYLPLMARPVRALGIFGHYVPDCSAVAAKYFAAQLRASGIAARYAGKTVTDRASESLATWSSAPLSAQVNVMLQHSENNIAEMLFRETALATGHPATWSGGSAAAAAALARFGVPADGLALADGSGLSRRDRITPDLLARVLALTADRTGHRELRSIYYGNALPIAGQTGTLGPGTQRFAARQTKCARGRISAKTGSLFDTTSLGGLAQGADGRLKAFAIIVNHRPQNYPDIGTRKAVDLVAATITGCY